MVTFLESIIVCILLLGHGLILAQTENPENLLLKNYRPQSIYKIPVTTISRAKYPVIDLHSHPYPKTEESLAAWVKTMDKVGIEKSIILTYSTGTRFDSIYAQFSKYGKRFELWCGFDYTEVGNKDWSDRAVKELERCYKAGARGVGELGDKGLGEFYSKPVRGYIHIDDPRMKPLIQKCGELNMPISIHVAEPMWMYEPMDSTNDGLFNAYSWKIDKSKPGLLGHAELVKTLEHAVKDNPKTIFIACHLANCEYDLSILGRMFDHYPNLYADVAARYGEIAPIPRYVLEFFTKYQNRIVYGTDMGMGESMYMITFRILETKDEHFYDKEHFNYHWPLHGFGLSNDILRKIYRENALKFLSKD